MRRLVPNSRLVVRTVRVTGCVGQAPDHHEQLLQGQAKSQRAFDLIGEQFATGPVRNLDPLTSEQSLDDLPRRLMASLLQCDSVG